MAVGLNLVWREIKELIDQKFRYKACYFSVQFDFSRYLVLRSGFYAKAFFHRIGKFFYKA